ncbi:hypothetical protein ACJX0J_040336, partial [Zea mays]
MTYTMLELSIVIGASFFFEIHFEKEWIRPAVAIEQRNINIYILLVNKIVLWKNNPHIRGGDKKK